MPTQVVHLPAMTLASIIDHRSASTARIFAARDLKVKEVETGGGQRALRVDFASLVYSPDLRSHFVDDLCGLLLTSAPAGEVHVPPPLLPDHMLSLVLDQTEAALHELPKLAGHDRLAIHDSFEEARKGRPIAREPHCRRPFNTYESKLLTQATEIHRATGPVLDRLDGKLASYQASLLASGMEAAVVRLGLQAELGLRLRLDRHGRAWVPRISGGTRRCGLGGLLRTTHGQLAAFQQVAEAIHEASIGRANWLQPAMLAQVHATLVSNLPGMERAGQLRTDEVHIRSLLDGDVTVVEVARPDIEQAHAEYAAGFDAALWRKIHPLIRCSLACLEFQRITPYSDATGRMARLILQGLMHENGVPALPLPAIFESNRPVYRASVDRGIQQRDALAFVQFTLLAIERAVLLGEHMIRALKPACEQAHDSFHRLGASERLARVASELTCSMVLGPDPQVIRRTIHGVMLSCYLSDCGHFDRVDAGSLGITLSGFDSDTAYSSSVARILTSGRLT
jgi:Fic/DOC family